MQDYEPNIDRLLALYQQLEDDIIASMIQRMLKMGYVSESTKYEAEVLQASGLLYEDILRLIAERMDATVQQVRALFEDAGVQTVNIDNEAHEAAGEVPIDIRQDKGMKQVLEAGYKKTLGTMHNLVSTTATQSQTAFIAACDRAYMQVSSGAFSYQQAIRQAVKSFGDIGAMVQYPSGHRDRLDVAMRRAVLTGVGQTSSALALEHAQKSGCYLMELTAHSGARPEHAAWQGQLVSLNGKDVGKTIDGLRIHSLSAIGYGSGAGFKGWNCRHNWHPYYPGLSTPNYTKAQLAKLDARDILYDGKLYTEYEISQKQREAERHVRALKRQVVASQTAVQNAPDETTKAALEADYTQNAVKLKAAEKQLRDFCKDTGRRNDTFRTQVAGFGRSEAQRAVMANKRAQNSLTSGTKSGIMNDNKTGIHLDTKLYHGEVTHYDITDERIGHISSTGIGHFSSEQNRKLTQGCKALLEYMKKDTLGREGALVFNMDISEIDRYKAPGATSSISLKSYPQDCIVIHNHPSDTFLSDSDLLNFYAHDELKILGAVGHNGSTYFVEKSTDYDALGFWDHLEECKLDFPVMMSPTDKVY